MIRNDTGWIPSKSRKIIDYIDPQADQFEIMDIAQALSGESRWAGQTQKLYFVAQHSVLTSYLVRKELQLEALLHDAAEAYCKDLPRPLKLLLPEYKVIEKRIDAAIRKQFGLPETLSPEVEIADRIVLATERRDLVHPDAPLPAETLRIIDGVRPMTKRIYAAHPEKALGMFCRRYLEIVGGDLMLNRRAA